MHGRVLYVGAGTGANLPHFRPRGQPLEIVLLDPSAGMLERARRKATQLALSPQLVGTSAEAMPFADQTFDPVIFTLTLCTIPDPTSAYTAG